MEFDFFDDIAPAATIVNTTVNKKTEGVNTETTESKHKNNTVNSKPKTVNRKRRSVNNTVNIKIKEKDLQVLLYLRSRRKQGCNAFNISAADINDFLYRIEEYIRKSDKNE